MFNFWCYRFTSNSDKERATEWLREVIERFADELKWYEKSYFGYLSVCIWLLWAAVHTVGVSRQHLSLQLLHGCTCRPTASVRPITIVVQ